MRPCTPRGTALSLDPCLQYGGIREERAIVGDLRVLLQTFELSEGRGAAVTNFRGEI